MCLLVSTVLLWSDRSCSPNKSSNHLNPLLSYQRLTHLRMATFAKFVLSSNQKNFRERIPNDMIFHDSRKYDVTNLALISKSLLVEGKRQQDGGIGPRTSVIWIWCTALWAIEACFTWDILKLSFVPAPLQILGWDHLVRINRAWSYVDRRSPK